MRNGASRAKYRRDTYRNHFRARRPRRRRSSNKLTANETFNIVVLEALVWPPIQPTRSIQPVGVLRATATL